MSSIYDFHSSPSINIHWIFNFRALQSNFWYRATVYYCKLINVIPLTDPKLIIQSLHTHTNFTISFLNVRFFLKKRIFFMKLCNDMGPATQRSRGIFKNFLCFKWRDKLVLINTKLDMHFLWTDMSIFLSFFKASDFFIRLGLGYHSLIRMIKL